jgi:hypothetical protein
MEAIAHDVLKDFVWYDGRRVQRPMLFGDKLHERKPHQRQIPDLPEILQPDTLAMLYSLQQARIADQGGW